MTALIGSTGFVGGHLQTDFEFTHRFNRANISDIQGLNTDILVCAGLPAEKWKANTNPDADWTNMAYLAQMISSMKAEKAILISTIDVYQPAFEVNEEIAPNYNGIDAYGRNRAWFEAFFASQFFDATIIRLPGLFAENLKKNLIYDLMNNRSDQFSKVHPESEFQFYDAREVWRLIEICMEKEISILNVATEPVAAQEVADIFNVTLRGSQGKHDYRTKSIHYRHFGGENGFLQSKATTLDKIAKLKVTN